MSLLLADGDGLLAPVLQPDGSDEALWRRYVDAIGVEEHYLFWASVGWNWTLCPCEKFPPEHGHECLAPGAYRLGLELSKALVGATPAERFRHTLLETSDGPGEVRQGVTPPPGAEA